MNLPHPVQDVFDHLTSVVKHVLPEFVHTTAPCDCCQRPAESFANQGCPGKTGYGVPYVYCPACESFNVGDINILGIERNKETHPDGSVTGVSHKFGMLAGSGCIVTASGHVVLFTPPGTYKKLPELLLSKFTVVECSIGGQLTYMSENTLDFPLIYIENFGKKTLQLIQGLRWSFTQDHIVACTDDGNSSMTESLNTFDLDRLMAISKLKDGLPNKSWDAFKKSVRRLSTGWDSPADFTEFMRKNECDELMQIYRLLPLDPHQRLSILLKVEKIA